MLKKFSLGISARRAQWATAWYSKVLLRGTVSLGELRAAVGRIGFVCGALRYDRLFLAPLYALIGALGRKRFIGTDTEVSLPKFLRMVFGWLLLRIQSRRHERCDFEDASAGQLFRVDAKAEGECIVFGGWKPVCGPNGAPDPWLSPWFSVRLDQTTAPWAYDRSGRPFRVVSALELLASTVAFMLFAPDAVEGQRLRAGVRVTSWTDSQVSVAAAFKGLSTSYPLCLVQMELAAQLESKRAVLEPDWAPRDLNQEADDLTNEVFGAFDPRQRVDVSMSNLPWLVFTDLVSHARTFYADILAAQSETRSSGAAAPAHAHRVRPHRLGLKRVGLRHTDPW